MTLLFQAGKSVKDKIIISLGETWPLKPKEILSNIKRNLNADVTYQAVYKSINELLEEGVIIKTDNGLMLDKVWLSSLKDYTNYADQSYKAGVSKKDIISPGQMTVDSVWDWYYHVLLTMEKLANDKYTTKLPVIVRGTHEWNALVFGKEQFIRALKISRKYDIYTTVSVDTSLGKTMANYWEKFGVHVAKIDPSVFLKANNDTFVIGDYIIQAIYPKDIFDALDNFYMESNNLGALDVIKLQGDVFYKKTDIHIITIKDKALADNLRKENLAFF